MNKRIILLLCCFCGLDAGEYLNEAKNLNNHFSSNFQNTITAPGTGAGSYTTLDGNSTFNANITCEGATQPIADISYLGTDDISIYINVDMDADGTKEKNYTFSGISGICSDGLIKCDSGSWNNCNYFSYQHNASNIYLQSSNRGNLSNCYCINSSCNSVAARDTQRVLDDISAAIYAILQNQMPRFVLTRINNDSSVVEIYGENQDACRNYQEGNSNYTYTETDNTSLINQGNEMMTSQQNDSNSAMSTLLNASANEDSIDFTTEKNQLRTRSSSIPVATENEKIVSAAGETFDMSRTEDLEEVRYCQVEKTVVNSHIFTDGSAANRDFIEYELRECIGTNNDICPIDSGESIKYECGEVNEENFSESVAGLGALNEIAKDISCSVN